MPGCQKQKGRGDLSNSKLKERQTPKGLAGTAGSHAEFVVAIKAYTQQHPWLTPEDALHNRLENELFFNAKDPEKATFCETVLAAWDTLAFDRYKPFSHNEHKAGRFVQDYSADTGSSVIHLTDPLQVRMIDAMCEAVGLPRDRGSDLISIPDKLQHYHQFEYERAQRSWEAEQAKKKP